jgi:hypothetical protein
MLIPLTKPVIALWTLMFCVQGCVYAWEDSVEFRRFDSVDKQLVVICNVNGTAQTIPVPEKCVRAVQPLYSFRDLYVATMTEADGYEGTAYRDLEFTEAQIKKIRGQWKDYSGEFASISLLAHGTGKWSRELEDRVSELLQKLNSADEVLLDHQKKRFSQIQFRSLCRQFGLINAILSDAAAELELSPEQRKELMELKGSLQQEFNASYLQMLKDVRLEAFKSLPAEIQRRIKQAFGDEWEKRIQARKGDSPEEDPIQVLKF